MSSENKNLEPEPGNKTTDKTVAILKGIAGLIPWVGTAFAEIITQTIPNQRMERIEKYLKYLGLKLEELKIEDVQAVIKQPENVDFFEDGVYLAARAMSDERMKYIANCVAGGIAKKEVNKIREKRVLQLLQEVDDEEIILLNGYCGQTKESKNAFSELRPKPACIGSSPDIVSEEVLFKTGIANLERFGLIETYYPFVKKGDSLQFDAFGKFNGGVKRITWLGRMLLKKIGLIDKVI